MSRRTATDNWFYWLGGSSLAVLVFVGLFCPEVIPFGYFEFWKMEGNLFTWLAVSTPVLVAAVMLNIAHMPFNRYREMGLAADFMAKGIKRSLRAGVLEEVIFRWLMFLAAIATVKLGNVVLFGVPEWLQMHIFGPLANWATLGYIREYLYHPEGWAIGAAILTSNAKFRSGHRYLGLIGWLNSWFMGLYFFWMMFTYGILAAIIVHVVYDIVCYGWHGLVLLYVNRREKRVNAFF